jgi:hypothetical protein
MNCYLTDGGGRLAGMMRASSAVALFAVAVCAAGVVWAQITGQVASGAAPGAQATVKVYTNPELHLTFAYPAELGPVDAAALAAVGKRMMYGADEEADPDHPRTDACTKVLLSVGKGSAGNAAQGNGGAAGSWVRLGLLDESAQCFPAKVFSQKKSTDALLRNLVKQATTVMGLMPLEQPAAYEIEGRRANFAAAQGEPVTGSDVQTAGEELIGVASVAVEGHVLTWVIETSDAATFNRLLGSGVDFGTGKAERLVPVEAR